MTTGKTVTRPGTSNPTALLVFLEGFRLFAERDIFFDFCFAFPGKKVRDCFRDCLIYHFREDGGVHADIQFFGDKDHRFKFRITLPVSKSMIVRGFIPRRSANCLCVRCCRFRSERTFHANRSSGLFTTHHLYIIVGCTSAHINNHRGSCRVSYNSCFGVKGDMDESTNTEEVKIRRGLPLMWRTPMSLRKIFQ